MLGLEEDDEPGTDPTVGGQRPRQIVGQLLGDEHDRLGLGDRVVEHPVEAPFGRRVCRGRRTDVGTRREVLPDGQFKVAA